MSYLYKWLITLCTRIRYFYFLFFFFLLNFRWMKTAWKWYSTICSSIVMSFTKEMLSIWKVVLSDVLEFAKCYNLRKFCVATFMFYKKWLYSYYSHYRKTFGLINARKRAQVVECMTHKWGLEFFQWHYLVLSTFSSLILAAHECHRVRETLGSLHWVFMKKKLKRINFVGFYVGVYPVVLRGSPNFALWNYFC